MPVIKVWCLKDDQTEEELNTLHKKIVAAVIEIPEMELKDENDMTCLFPPDSMKYGLGNEIIVEIEVFNKPKRTTKVLQKLAKNVGSAVKKLYPTAKVECSIHRFKPEEGFWSSDTNQKEESTWEKISKVLNSISLYLLAIIYVGIGGLLFLSIFTGMMSSPEPKTWQLLINLFLTDSANFFLSSCLIFLTFILREIK